jgi:hypothetical protein
MSGTTGTIGGMAGLVWKIVAEKLKLNHVICKISNERQQTSDLPGVKVEFKCN